VAYDRRFGEYVRDLLQDLGEIRIRPMFGAGGLYSGELMFAMIHEDVLYLRAGPGDEAALIEAGSRQFTYPMKDGTIMPLSYWSLPDEAADDPEAAVTWARGSLAAAAVKKQGKGAR
jgi:DNA transformation protein